MNSNLSYSPERSIRVKIGDFLSVVTLKLDGWPWKTIGHLFYTSSTFVHHFKAIGEFKLDFQSGNAEFGSKSAIFVPSDLEIWWRTLKNNRAPLLHHIKLCASFQSHRWIKTWVTIQKGSIRVKIGNFFVLCDLEIWCMTLKKNRAPLLCWFKICASFFYLCDLEAQRMSLENNRALLLSNTKHCAPFHPHMWIQTGVIVQKWLNGVLTSVTLNFDLWPWHFAWTSLSSMVIAPEIFRDDMMKGTLWKRCHRWIDGRTEVFLELLGIYKFHNCTDIVWAMISNIPGELLQTVAGWIRICRTFS